MGNHILCCGDSGVSVVLGDEISPVVASRVWHLRDIIEAAITTGDINGIVSLVPSYTALLVEYNSLVINYGEMVEFLSCCLKSIENTQQQSTTTRVIEIPVLYGDEYGLDLQHVCNHTGLSESEVISIHTGTDYLIYMIGFTPGFPYLGGMDKRIATPRLTVPRVKLEAGAVGIAGEQTGIYPISSPGGWQIIGNTPLKLYDPKAEEPILLRAGDYLRFRSVTKEEYHSIKTLAAKGEAKPKILTKEVIL